MLSKIAATSLVSLCLATASLAQSSGPDGAANDHSSPLPRQTKINRRRETIKRERTGYRTPARRRRRI